MRSLLEAFVLLEAFCRDIALDPAWNDWQQLPKVGPLLLPV